MIELTQSIRACALLAAVVASPVFATPEQERAIVGGVPAFDSLQFPYNVLNFCCSGALIAPDIYLTSASCFYYFPGCDTGLHAVGTYEISAMTTDQIGGCEEVINDPKYDPVTLAYDFALCKLNRTFTIDESLVTLSLNADDSYPLVGSELITMGFGHTEALEVQSQSEFEFKPSDVLMNVTLPIISNEDCAGVLGDLIDDSTICTLVPEGGKDACVYDSGGPLVQRTYQGDGTFVDIHVGIVKFGFGCAQPGVPRMYSRTSSNIEWIKETACNELNSVASFCDPPTAAPTADRKSVV